jgi:hypothetical protein
LAGAFQREFQLGSNIVRDGVGGVALELEMRKSGIPFGDQIIDDGCVDRLLGFEIIVDVGLGQARSLRDLRDAGSVITLARENFDRSIEDARSVRSRICRPPPSLRADRVPGAFID